MFLDLVLEIARPLDLDGYPRELELRAVPAALELAQARRILDERAALRRLGGEDLLDPTLADDRVHLAAEPDVREKLHEVESPHRRPVHQVLALAAPVEPAGDRELRVRERAVAVLVVEEELDLTPIGRPARAGAGVDDVVGLLGAQLGRAQRAGRPDDRVRDVRLPGAVRPDDDGDSRLEAHLDRIRERLEAAQLDRAQEHAPPV